MSILLTAVNNSYDVNVNVLEAQMGSMILQKHPTINRMKVLGNREWGGSEHFFTETDWTGFLFIIVLPTVMIYGALIEISKHQRVGMCERFVWTGRLSCRHNAITDLELLAGNAVNAWRVISYPEFSSPEGSMKGSSASRRLRLCRG